MWSQGCRGLLFDIARVLLPRLQQLPIRPVLKHGPRSLACARVNGWKTQRRNESESPGILPSAGAPGYRYSCIVNLADSERTR